MAQPQVLPLTGSGPKQRETTEAGGGTAPSPDACLKVWTTQVCTGCVGP